jgi:hypothetical protein
MPYPLRHGGKQGQLHFAQFGFLELEKTERNALDNALLQNETTFERNARSEFETNSSFQKYKSGGGRGQIRKTSVTSTSSSVALRLAFGLIGVAARSGAADSTLANHAPMKVTNSVQFTFSARSTSDKAAKDTEVESGRRLRKSAKATNTIEHQTGLKATDHPGRCRWPSTLLQIRRHRALARRREAA